jgi:glycosyltransferase involved in cell wall biosynthesis
VTAKPLRGVRILFVLPSLGLGGAERQAFYLARHLRQNEEADARLLSLSRRDALADTCKAAQLPFDFFDLRHEYGSRLGQAADLFRFTRLLRQHRVQVLLPYCMFQNVLCGLTWRIGGARVCIWNQRDEGRSRLDSWIERLAVAQTTRFISNSTHGADFVINDLHVSPDKVNVVPNGIVMPSAKSPQKDWRQELGIPASSFVATMVANLHSMKDHATLICAWSHVVRELPAASGPAHLLLAGAFHDTHQALVKQVDELALTNYVHFLGQIQPVDDLLRSVDLAVFSSYNEGIPNAVLEPMSHGLAVVATDYPGIREAVGPDGLSLLARPKDPRALADTILMAAMNPSIRTGVGERSRLRVAESFGVDRMAAAMTSLISSEWQSRVHKTKGK